MIGRLIGKLSTAPVTMDPDFDPVFYGSFYPDLKSLGGPAALQSHYRSYGRNEGRLPNEKSFYADLQSRLGPLPDRFDARTYRLLHPDLRAKLPHDWAAAEHYLLQGKKEKREYFRFDADLYRSLYFAATVITDYELGLHYREVGRDEGRIGSWSELIESMGVSGGAWLEHLKTDEFALLNWSWAGEVTTKLDAVRAMLSEGVDRLAPIAFDQAFDPAYYRETHPQHAGLSDPDLYRRWLFQDLETDAPGSPEQHLRKLDLPLREYPSGFDWRAYVAAQPKAGSTRWTALEHLLTEGYASGAQPPLTTEGAAEFLVALGHRVRMPPVRRSEEAAPPADPTADKAQARRRDELAVSAFRQARDLGEHGYEATHHLADALFRLERYAEALPLYQEAARFAEAEVWTYVNGSRAAAKTGRFHAGVALLQAGKAGAGGEPVWRDAVHKLSEAYFTARTNRARQLYRFGEEGRARADRRVAEVIARTAKLWTGLDPRGAPTPASAKGRVVVLASTDIQVCNHYRIEQKQELFDLLDRPVEFYPLEKWRDFLSALHGASAAFFFRLPAWPTVVRAMTVARRMGVPTYYEIDDLIFDAKEYPDTLESYGGLLSKEAYEGLLFGVPLFRAAVEMCDYGISSTTPLARAVEPLVRTGKVFWLPNGLDSRNEPLLDATPARVRRDDSVMVAYASGTKAHNSDFNELAGPALVELLKRRPNVKLLLVGYLALDPAFDAVREQIIRFDYVNGAMEFWSLLADADVNLAVLKPTWATDSKSEIKWLEAAVMGIPSVVSETAMYREVLEDGVDALIVRTPEEWLQALERLVDDAGLRRRIGEAARKKASERYTVEANARRLEALLAPADATRLRAEPTPATPRKPRVLLANVWFPPQTVGGATRVVRDNLDAWIRSGAADEIDFAVLTTDLHVQPPHKVRVDDYGGVPVIRISTPARKHEDWRPEDLKLGAIALDFIESWKPDLLHVHAPQRLTASVVHAAQEAGVPYIATVHDAWWLSDHHFLVDERGRVRQPCEDLPRDPPKGITISQSLDRRRVLGEALRGADAVLGVSETFADMYRSCGFERALAVPNGLPPLRPCEREPSPSGRVRLAHVGNVSKHKGYHLVEAAIRQGGFKNLEVTVIDHALPAGSARRTNWGGTPVRVTGRVPAEHIGDFYARTDVLLAPSIWPESFGLVTREALACGCWVVASNRGAMGEDVQPGVNGFVVDVSSPEGLLAALREIDADPARFLQAPAERPALRSADDQAREVLEIYRRLLAGQAAAPGLDRAAPRPRDLPSRFVNQISVAPGPALGD